jgi:chromosomal replication initiator protein
MALIAAEVAKAHGLTVDDLKGASHRRHVAWPRQEAYARCYALRKHYGDRYSLPRIGKFFGNRDHTTVLWGVRAFAARQAEAGE